jgi:hypothetical protein
MQCRMVSMAIGTAFGGSDDVEKRLQEMES